MKIEDIVGLSQSEYMSKLLPMSGKIITVECHDGRRTTTYGVLAFSWAYFEFNRKWNVPVSVKQVPGTGTIPSNKLHSKLMNLGLTTVYHALDKTVTLNDISTSGYDVVCNQINQSILHLESYAMVLDAEDYWDIINDPVVKGIRERMRTGAEASRTSSKKFGFIQTAYSEFAEFITSNWLGSLKHNGLAQLIISGTSKLTQVNQGIIARGFCSDVNSDFFAEPILSSFADGLNTLYEFALETGSGAKSFMYQKDPMSETEYLHRLVQMIAASFQNLHLGDCGSRVTYPFKVEERHTNAIVGKYYIEKDQVFEVTQKNASSFVGKTLNFRSVAGCNTGDPVGACSVCCGASSLNLAPKVNVGHTAGTRFMGTGSQKLLSVKHEDLAALSIAMSIASQFNSYFTVAKNNREITLDKTDVTIAIPEKYMEHIRYVYYVDDVSTFNLTEFTAIPNIEVADNTDDGYGEITEGCVGNKGEVLHLSVAMLEYIKADPKRLVLQSYKRKRYYFIDMSAFPKDEAVFLAPFKHFDMLIQHKLTKRFLYSPKAEVKDGSEHSPRLTDYNTFGEAATALLELTIEKLGINLSVLEMAIYAFTVTDANNYDFRPARHTNSCQFFPMEALYNHRSLAAKLVSENQLAVLKSPLIITNVKRSAHPYDGLYIDDE